MSSAAEEFAKEVGATVDTVALLPEAPASANVRVSVQGYDVQFTLRGWSENEVLDRLNGFLARLAQSGGVLGAIQTVTAQGPAAVKASDVEGDQSFVCPQFILERRTDGKLKLHLFTVLGQSGAVSQFPEVYHTAEKAAMWEIMKPVSEGIDFSELPLKQACRWQVTYKLGRETAKGGRYKDLQSLELLA